MEKEHEFRLDDIAGATGLDKNNLKELYMHKTNQYFLRDKTAKGEPSETHYQRAIDVIQKYATQKYNYCESWFE